MSNENIITSKYGCEVEDLRPQNRYNNSIMFVSQKTRSRVERDRGFEFLSKYEKNITFGIVSDPWIYTYIIGFI